VGQGPKFGGKPEWGLGKGHRKGGAVRTQKRFLSEPFNNCKDRKKRKAPFGRTKKKKKPAKEGTGSGRGGAFLKENSQWGNGKTATASWYKWLAVA